MIKTAHAKLKAFVGMQVCMGLLHCSALHKDSFSIDMEVHNSILLAVQRAGMQGRWVPGGSSHVTRPKHHCTSHAMLHSRGAHQLCRHSCSPGMLAFPGTEP